MCISSSVQEYRGTDRNTLIKLITSNALENLELEDLQHNPSIHPELHFSISSSLCRVTVLYCIQGSAF